MKNSRTKSWIPGGVFDSEALKRQIEDIEREIGAPDFWDNPHEAERKTVELNQLKAKYDPWVSLVKETEDMADLYAMAVEEGDESLEQDLSATLENLTCRFEKLKILELLSEETDPASAYLTIHSGAGGTEACDWVSMLYRMYTRWMEARDYKFSVIDLQEAEGGFKSVTVEAKGEYAYGYLKGETGIHRLVRISPFDSNSRRHTSFASVYVSPIIDDAIEVDIQPADLRVDTYRASGAGGQHVNKTDSAVRMTHLPTGIVVQCQNERSQHKNRETAMKVLRSRLYEYYKAEQEKEQAASAQEKKDISWGNQIRSYVFQPYTMVKDLRTNEQSGNIQAVMDGALEPFIEAFLRMKWSQ